MLLALPDLWASSRVTNPLDLECWESINTFNAQFSHLFFGDGDPNQGIEEERWKLGDDSYILPVLLRFEGQPEVDDEGNILYRFPTLQRTASPQRKGRKEYVGRKWTEWVGGVEKFFEEKKWRFSQTSTSERAMVIGLGGLNLFGVIILGTMLKNVAVRPSGFITFVSDIFPLLQIYAASFFAIPAVRWFFVRNRNDGIEKRNLAREQRAQALESPDLSLRRKNYVFTIDMAFCGLANQLLSVQLLSARDMAQRTFIGQDRIVYSTDKDFLEQDYEARDWDKRFRDIEKSD
ncbi:iron-sulfur cluster biosynthesis family protein [Actinidia rufa]|uniref:Iron-sulfur cluster biosynthesis family protein n=1 Tax=Actinidia rufa TaxID=165716 RepID=A0A7J0H0P2_9ERIC|nr:iron-sulfur cluster biosynthesis family protein [Actinidia rufa]